MAIGTIAAMAAPAAINGLSRILTKPKTTKLEKEYQRMADFYKNEMGKTFAETDEVKQALGQIDNIDQKARNMMNSQTAATGATDEKALAMMDSQNQKTGKMVSGIFDNADEWRQQMQSNYMNMLGGANKMRQNSLNKWNQNIQSIVKPVSQASQAFSFSQMYGNGGSDNNSQNNNNNNGE